MYVDSYMGVGECMECNHKLIRSYSYVATYSLATVHKYMHNLEIHKIKTIISLLFNTVMDIRMP